MPASPKLFEELFDSVPQPVRPILHTALHLPDLLNLEAQARLNSSSPLSRTVLELLQVRMRVLPEEMERFPRTGPLVVVANHPFGILDGLMLDALLLEARPDMKILTNSLVARAEEIRERCIAVDVFKPATSMANFRAVRQAKQWLKDGHGVAIFPAGEVSHWRAEQRCVTDPPWSDTAARFALDAQATVAPVYFVGCNSFAFQLAGLLHPRMRTVQLPRELLNKRGSTIEVRVGMPIGAAELARQKSIQHATAYLRARTYMLGHRKTGVCQAEPGSQAANHRPAAAVAAASEAERVRNEIRELEARGREVIRHGGYSVFAERGEAMPGVLREIGRLREITFRAAGEGTGKRLDLDAFDPYYTHLVLWHKEKQCIVGGYRLAWTEDVVPRHGAEGLYTSTLFRFAPKFFKTIGPAVELGRTFIGAEFQRDYAPLMLLWQAIGRLVAARPTSPVLFGAVSISANYSQAAIELMVEFLRQRRLRADLAQLVTPRRPFRSRRTRAAEIRQVAACLSEIEELAAPLAEIDDSGNVPVLLRQYVRLGGRVAAFNVDRNFSNMLDGLLVVDLRETTPKLLARYMGAEAAAIFLREGCTARSA